MGRGVRRDGEGTEKSKAIYGRVRKEVCHDHIGL